MNKLKEHFRMNGLPYTLLKQNEVVALYSIGGEFTDEILHWEVDIIYNRKDKYGEREHIATNEQFGRDRGRCFSDEKLALDYFDELTNKLELYQGVPKVVTGVEEKVEVIPEYDLVSSYYPCYSS